jgi:hypothetical protein
MMQAQAALAAVFQPWVAGTASNDEDVLAWDHESVTWDLTAIKVNACILPPRHGEHDIAC